jgi:eukaryotic-like serine/threonine-protein kinase
MMTPDRWQRLNDIFHAALERPAEERANFLQSACADDLSLLEASRKLLYANEHGRGLTTALAQEAQGIIQESDRERAIGRHVGAWCIEREIGHGGMGTVYLARRADAQFEKLAAIKLINRGMDTASVLRRFRDERQILARLEHENIAHLLDGGSTKDGLPYFVMEYIEGQSIDDWCEGHGLAVAERLRLFQQVCAAVSYAHQHLVIHRDIKPSNILVTERGVPKLLDFGIAKIMRPEPSQETIEMVAAPRSLTPEYASPEQMRGLPVTTLSDVYSLGVVLFRLLTGRLPWAARSGPLEALAETRSATTPPRPSEVVLQEESCNTASGGVSAAVDSRLSAVRLHSRLRGDLDTIVLKALHPQPDRRYQSVEHLADDIRRHLEGLPVSARLDSVWYRTAKFVRRNRVAVIAAIFVTMSLFAGLVGTAWQAQRALHQESIAKAEQARAERRFAEVRELARRLLFDYHDAVKDLMGATPVRARLVQDGLDYLDRLASDAEGDPTLQQELAAAYERVGDIQGNTTVANLGDTIGAISSHRKALTLREKLAAADPENGVARRDLALSHRKVGALLWETGDVHGALAEVRLALNLLANVAARQPEVDGVQREIAKAHDFVGRILQEQGDVAEAREHYAHSSAILEEMLSTTPDDEDLQRGLSVVRELEGSAHMLAGDLEAALDRHRAALALRERIAAANPLNADYQRIVSVSWYNIGEVLSALGETEQALDSFRRDAAIVERLAAADPQNEQYRGDLAYAYIRVGDMLAKLGASAEALGSYRSSLELRAADVTRDPANLWKRGSLIEAHAKISSALLAVNPTAARLEAEKALALMDETEIDPQNALFRSFFAHTYADIGDLHAQLARDSAEHTVAALDLYSRAEAIWRSLEARGSLSTSDVQRRQAMIASMPRNTRAQAGTVEH